MLGLHEAKFFAHFRKRGRKNLPRLESSEVEDISHEVLLGFEFFALSAKRSNALIEGLGETFFAVGTTKSAGTTFLCDLLYGLALRSVQDVVKRGLMVLL